MMIIMITVLIVEEGNQYADLFAKISDTKAKFQDCRILHILREQNKIADNCFYSTMEDDDDDVVISLLSIN